MSATVQVLDASLTLVHQEIPHIPTVTIDVWLRGGTVMETTAERGVAHFVEHMVFKGTARVKPGEFDRLVESLGSVTSAATSYDYTRYSLTTPREHFKTVLPYLGEMLLGAQIPETELEAERQVVLAELAQAWSNPDWISYQFLLATIFDNHPYGSPVIGSETEVNQLQREHLCYFHHKFYQNSPIVVVVVGSLPLDQVLEPVQSAFHRPIADTPPCPQYPVPPLPGIIREELYLPHLPQDRLLLAWLGPRATELQGTIGMELLSHILGEGRHSRLPLTLKPWGNHVSSGYIAQEWGGFFTISTYLEQEQRQAVESTILQVTRDLAAHPITAEELKRAQRALHHNFAFLMESPPELAHFLGYHALLGSYDLCHHWDTLYPELVWQTTAPDLLHLAQTYLLSHRYVSLHITTSPPQFAESGVNGLECSDVKP
ncbi:MAG: M16 family metallopeptidase [Pseudanabaenaceae cyanobacterium]